MIIPESFKLHGQTILVEYALDLAYTQGAYGTANFDQNIIQLQPENLGHPIPKEMVEQTFIHEVVHHILNHMDGKYANDLKDDEEFVERFSKLLHQMLITQTGELKYETGGKDIKKRSRKTRKG
jgi:predicted SprT family Zn-dependent metalloprotease